MSTVLTTAMRARRFRGSEESASISGRSQMKFCLYSSAEEIGAVAHLRKAEQSVYKPPPDQPDFFSKADGRKSIEKEWSPPELVMCGID